MIDKLYIMLPEIREKKYNKQAAYEYWKERVAPTTIAEAKILSSIFDEEVAPQQFNEWLKTPDADRFKVAKGVEKVYYKPLDPKAVDYRERLDNMTKEQVNNHIFDIQCGIITNEASMIKLFNPGSFDVQKKASRIISIARDTNSNLTYEQLMEMNLSELDKMIPKESRNILDATTQVYFFNQNMTAGKLIGVFANANVSHVFCNLIDIICNAGVKFNGIELNNVKWDPTYSMNGRFVSKNIAGYVGASVDAVKDPVFANMNINMNTVNAALVLTRLGVNPEEIALLTAQPIIVKFSRAMDLAKEKSSYVDPIDVITEVLLSYGSTQDIETLNHSLDQNDFNADDLFNNIKNEDTEFSLRVGVLFRQLLMHSEDMKGITYCTKFNSITNAPGPLFTDNIYAKRRVDTFRKKVEGQLTMFSESAVDVIGSNEIIDSIYSATMSDGNIVKNIASQHWKYYDTTFATITKKIEGLIGRPIKGEKLEKVYQDYIYFCLANDNLEIPIINSDDMNEMIINFPSKYYKTLKEIEEKYPDVYEHTIKYNPLIQRLKRVSPSQKFPIVTLQMESGKMNGEIQEEIKSGWSALVNSGNNEVRELGLKLFFYNLYRSGFRFSPKTFLHLAPVDVKNAVYGYIETLSSNQNFELDNELINSFICQYNRNHPDEFLFNIESIEDAVANDDSIVIPTRTLDIILSVLPNGATVVKPIIKYQGDLYVAERNSTTDTKIKYYKVEQLGVENNVVEYQFTTNKFIKSSIRPNIEKISKNIPFNSRVEDNDTNTNYSKNAGETPDNISIPEQKNIPNQLNEEQLQKALNTTPMTRSISEDSDTLRAELLPFFKEGSIFSTTMTFDEFIKICAQEGAFDNVEREEIKSVNRIYQNVYNQIQEIIKTIC